MHSRDTVWWERKIITTARNLHTESEEEVFNSIWRDQTLQNEGEIFWVEETYSKGVSKKTKQNKKLILFVGMGKKVQQLK